jgi:hypothetical protein
LISGRSATLLQTQTKPMKTMITIRASASKTRTATPVILATAAVVIFHLPSASWAQTTATSVAPTAKTPFVVPADPAAKQRLIKAINEYMTLPPKQVHAHPAAADFPGVVPAGTPHVTRVVTVHGPGDNKHAGRSNGWRSTGLYADAGSLIKVELLSPLPAGVSLEIRIGCHTDRLFGDKIREWKRFPSISRSFPITDSTAQVANAFGGPLFVIMQVAHDTPLPQSKITLRFSNVVEAPYFVLGQTTPANWKELRTAPAPWGELVGRNMILHFPSEQIRSMDDPAPLLEWWDKVVAAEDGLVGWPPRTVQERVVPDRQISAGWMHSGYPFMCHMASAPTITDLAKLRTDGDWGFFHELGHNHQSKDWTFHKPFSQTEVTVNFFSLYCMEHICGKPTGVGHGGLEGDKLLKALDQRFGDPPSTSPFDQLTPFVVLLHKFGWDSLRQTLASYQEHPNPSKMTEEERQAEFVRRYSQYAKADLSGYFKRLGYACPPEVVAELHDLPAFDYDAWRKAYRPNALPGPANHGMKKRKSASR